MARLSARSSSLGSSSGSRFIPTTTPDDYLKSQFESYASFCDGSLTKKGWRSFLAERCYEKLRDEYFDFVLSPFADKTFTSLSKGLARSQSMPLQLSLDDTVIQLPPVLVVRDSEVKGHKVYSTLRDSTLRQMRFHLDFMAKQLAKRKEHLDKLESAYSHFLQVVRGDVSASLRDVVKLFQKR